MSERVKALIQAPLSLQREMAPKIECVEELKLSRPKGEFCLDRTKPRTLVPKCLPFGVGEELSCSERVTELAKTGSQCCPPE